MTHRITIALEEGFVRDHVRIEAGGRVLAELSDVTTRVQIGLARSVEAELKAGEDKLLVILPDKGMTKEIELGADPPSYVGVSVVAEGRDVAARTGDAPLGYA